MNGILNVLKPPHMTSHDIVSYIRKKINIKKVGHTGTLDPMAAGVLPICIGKATKISQYMLNDSKKYRCEMTLGINTDTQDRWGKPLIIRDVNVSELDILRAFKAFRGEIYQVPPMYSALKHQGKKLYELAREGNVVHREARPIYIHDIKIISVKGKSILFDVLCSKGTYVRTLCEDIGNYLNCGAHMSFLLRTESGKFKLDNSITLESIDKLTIEQIKEDYLMPLDFPLLDMTKVIVKDEAAEYLLNGNNIYLKNILFHDELKIASNVRLYIRNEFIALGKVKKENELFIDIDRVFS